MNTCVDCKHHTKDSLCQHWCTHPNNGVDPIRGGTRWHLCTFFRSSLYGPCGPAGDLFEAATNPPVEPETYWVPPTLWQRIKTFFTRVCPW